MVLQDPFQYTSYLNRSLQYLKASVACTVTRTAMVEEWFRLTSRKQHNDRLNITTKGLERYGSCRILSVVYQLPEPKLAVLESVGGLHRNSNGHG
jgi:hypothetical protein